MAHRAEFKTTRTIRTCILIRIDIRLTTRSRSGICRGVGNLPQGTANLPWGTRNLSRGTLFCKSCPFWHSLPDSDLRTRSHLDLHRTAEMPRWKSMGPASVSSRKTEWPPPCEEDFLTHRQPNPHRHCSSSSCTPATPITSSMRHHCPGLRLHIPYSQVPLMPTLSAIVGSILDSVIHCGCAALACTCLQY